MDHRTSLVLVCGICQVFGVRIIGCINDKIEILEDSPSPVTCEDIDDISDAVWRQGEGLIVGVCSADGICSNNVPNDFRLSRSPMSTKSQLTLVPGYRRHAGVTVTCQDQELYSFTTCTIVIIPSVRLPATDSSSSVKPETGSMSVATLTGAIIGSIAIVAVIVAVIVLLIVRRRRRLHRTSSEGSLPSDDSTTGPSHRGLPTIPPAIPPFYLDNKQTDTSSHPTGSVYEEPIPLANHSPGLTETPVPPKQEDDVYIELDIAYSATT
ncbi:uncharacterized protein LOC112569019 [Pomacea canaliculata]|uniref:uncharacterized protein LOC112569019 n=1 Tax=Pomacea canaliculata TaxID=400727 RepID=UPI000D72B882|nr:uncharacterized protein LOC112569019 [Pomacea canaliculata]